MNLPEIELIGICLKEKQFIPDLATIDKSIFTDPFSIECLKVIRKSFESGTELDEYSLMLGLLESKKFDQTTITETIGDAVSTIGDDRTYYTIKNHLIEQRNRRDVKRLIDKAALMIEKGNSFSSVNSFLISSIISLSERANIQTGFVSIKEASMKLAERLEKIHKGEIKRTFTGLKALDKHLGGIEAPDVVYIGARPSMGKTSLATKFLENIAVSDPEKDNLIFSLETSDIRIAEKIHTQRGRIEQNKFNNCSLNQEDWDRLIKSIDSISGLNNIQICDRVNITEKDVLAECIKHQYKKQVGSFFLDYLQLLKSPPGQWSREREVAEQSRTMKVIAKQLNCPAFILSQLNRSLETRSDKEPNLSDMRDSGALEQDADIILFIYRPEVYDREKEKGKAKIIIAKNKRGKPGFVWVGWNGETTRFYDI